MPGIWHSKFGKPLQTQEQADRARFNTADWTKGMHLSKKREGATDGRIEMWMETGYPFRSTHILQSLVFTVSISTEINHVLPFPLQSWDAPKGALNTGLPIVSSILLSLRDIFYPFAAVPPSTIFKSISHASFSTKPFWIFWIQGFWRGKSWRPKDSS